MIGEQATIPGVSWELYNTRYAVGAAGEITIARALQAQGYRVDVPHKFQQGDLLVFTPDGRTLTIEVKTARRGADRTYAFTLYKYWHKKVRAELRFSSMLIALCVYPTGQSIPFVIPTRYVADKHTLKVTSDPVTYAGKYACFRQSISSICLEV